jgi:hypothetical protein
MYLPAETVRSMAEEAGSAGVNTWILDLNSRALMRVVHADQASTIDSLRASTHLEPSEIQEVLKDTGWELLDEKRYIRDGGRYALTRMQREGMQPDPNAERIPEDDPGGVAVYRRRPA